MRIGFTVKLALLAALIGFFASISFAAPPSKTLPEIKLKDWGGKERAITRGRDGGKTLIFFWSVFCPNCKEIMPKLASFRPGGAKNFSVYAVNVDGDHFTNAIKAFMDDNKPKYTVVLDRFENGAMVAADPLAVAKTPTLVLVDAGGKVLLRQEVEVNLAEVEKLAR